MIWPKIYVDTAKNNSAPANQLRKKETKQHHIYTFATLTQTIVIIIIRKGIHPLPSIHQNDRRKGNVEWKSRYQSIASGKRKCEKQWKSKVRIFFKVNVLSKKNISFIRSFVRWLVNVLQNVFFLVFLSEKTISI